jgi:penicillin-binding protein A
MNNKNLVKNIKVLLIFFSLCFFSIIIYLTYFDLFLSEKLSQNSANQRTRLEENKVLRGSIMDKNGTVLVYSEAVNGKEQKRIYKFGELFAHVTGYNSYRYGKRGVEQAYNDVLTGKTTSSYNLVGNFFKGLKEMINKDEKRGNDVYLTLDKELQEVAFNALGNNRGAVAAVNVKTGEILALVSKPSFNPQYFVDDLQEKLSAYNKEDAGAPQVNRAVNGVYPPGSTFKLVTTASALENIKDVGKKSYNCSGALSIYDYVLKDHGGSSHGNINLETAFKVSCNITFGQIGMALGYDNLKNTAEKFMFNKNISFNDDFSIFDLKEGEIQLKDKRNNALLAQNAIGQNQVTSNPLHMALVTAAIANDGVMMSPYLVKEIKDRYNVTLYAAKPEKLTEAVSVENSQKIKQYMEETVKTGTGKNARITGVKVGGKTGTAEVSENQEPHSWFVAYGGIESPEIAVAVIVENGGTGGGKAAPIAREIIKTYLKK